MSYRSDLSRRVRIGMWVLAVPTLLTGLWAVFAPDSWYADFGGIAPPSAFGAYNEHFVQDLGSGYLGIGAVLVWAAVNVGRDLVRGALIGFIVFTLPHFVIHLTEAGDLDRGGYLFTNALLGFGLVVALWVWWLNERRAGGGTTAEAEGRTAGAASSTG